MNMKLVLTDDERTRCEVWTRVMGYHRPVSAFNLGKQQEHMDRVQYRVGKGMGMGMDFNLPSPCLVN
jgi:hypothetical protein